METEAYLLNAIELKLILILKKKKIKLHRQLTTKFIRLKFLSYQNHP